VKQKLVLSPSPHIHHPDSVPRLMWLVVIALTPAAAGAVYFFGWPALMIMAVSVLTAVVTEAAILKARHLPATVSDGSAVITGLLLAFNLPATAPWWLATLGSFFAIAIGKQVFGGLGFNPMNPALLGRAFLLASWPVRMTASWAAPRGGTTSGIAAITSATPLGALKEAYKMLDNPHAAPQAIETARETINGLMNKHVFVKLAMGNVGGCLGETSALLIILGAAFLLLYRVIDWRTPLAYIGSVALLSWAFGGRGLFHGNPIFHVFSGGLLLGAFFMATDLVTTPVTRSGRWIFGIGCGCLTTLIRLAGGYPEGVSYSILLMNLTVPLLDRGLKPKPFGAQGR